MKRFRIVLFSAALLLSMSAFAQWQEMGQGSGGGRRGMGRRNIPSVDDQVKQLDKQLKLTDEQKTQIRSILSDERTQMQQLMQDQSVARQDRRSKMRDIHQSATEKINGLLNDEQKKKYADYEQKRREQMQQRRRGGMEPSSE